MKLPFQINDKKEYRKVVSQEDTASFEVGQVHPVYSTFALGRDAEWCCRLFVLDMKEEDEEGIGTFLNIEHVSPALIGSEVRFEAILTEVNKNAVICDFKAYVGDRLVARGKQGQKIIKKKKIEKLFASL